MCVYVRALARHCRRLHHRRRRRMHVRSLSHFHPRTVRTRARQKYIDFRTGPPLSHEAPPREGQVEQAPRDWQLLGREMLGGSLLGAHHGVKAGGLGSCASSSTWAERRGFVRGPRRHALRCAPGAHTDNPRNRVCEPNTHARLLVHTRASSRACVWSGANIVFEF